MNRVAAIALVTTLALASCAVGPDYRPPKSAAPGNWSEAQLGGETNSAVQVVRWWTTFNDPELDSLVERAVKANHDLRIAAGQLLEARALRSGAYWDLGPTINGSAAYTDTRLSRNAQSSTNMALHTDLYDAGAGGSHGAVRVH
jgi:outer membrane protein TolC